MKPSPELCRRNLTPRLADIGNRVINLPMLVVPSRRSSKVVKMTCWTWMLLRCRVSTTLRKRAVLSRSELWLKMRTRVGWSVVVLLLTVLNPFCYKSYKYNPKCIYLCWRVTADCANRYVATGRLSSLWAVSRYYWYFPSRIEWNRPSQEKWSNPLRMSVSLSLYLGSRSAFFKMVSVQRGKIESGELKLRKDNEEILVK